MQSIITLEVVEHPYISTWKVHHLACLEVKKIIDKITKIFTSLESARPRCKSGLQVLCSLHHCIEKCKLLLLHCSESSKLYLAISGERIILRCERIRNSLELCLSQLQNMVEPTLAARISKIIDYIKTVPFTLDSSEDQAGQVLLALLHQDITASKTTNLNELKSFKFAAIKLHITSPLAQTIEKRSIRRLLTKIPDSDFAKKKILNYLLYLVRKYGKSIDTQETEIIEPPLKFKNRHLSILSSSSSSVPSFNSSLADLNLHVDNVSFQSLDTESSGFETEDGIKEKCGGFKGYSSINEGPNLFILGNLVVLPWESRRKAVEDVKNKLKDDRGCNGFVSTGYVKPVFKFLKEAHRLGDSGAKRHGVELLLMFLKECRTDVPPLPKEAMYDLSSFLDTEITEEAFLILELLSHHQHYTIEIVSSGILSFLLDLIKNPTNKHHNIALKVLRNLSIHTDLGHHLIYLGFIQQLVPFLDDLLLAGYCIEIFNNLCSIEESVAQFVENEHCIASIVELLEVGKDEEQEHALDILLLLCYECEEVCETLMFNDCIVSSLVSISRNGSCKGKLTSVVLLRLLNNVADDRSQMCSFSDTSHSQSTNGNPKMKNTCNKSSSGFFGRIILKFRKFVR